MSGKMTSNFIVLSEIETTLPVSVFDTSRIKILVAVIFGELMVLILIRQPTLRSVKVSFSEVFVSGRKKLVFFVREMIVSAVTLIAVGVEVIFAAICSTQMVLLEILVILTLFKVLTV